LQAYRKKKRAKETKFLDSFSEEKENSPQPFVVPPTPPAHEHQSIQQEIGSSHTNLSGSFQITPESSFQSTPQPSGYGTNNPNMSSGTIGKNLAPPPTPLQLDEAEMPEHEQAQINRLMNQVVSEIHFVPHEPMFFFLTLFLSPCGFTHRKHALTLNHFLLMS
jgi:hypothetical protein